MIRGIDDAVSMAVIGGARVRTHLNHAATQNGRFVRWERESVPLLAAL